MGRDRSRPALCRKQASYASAFTSHGCPCVRSHTRSRAPAVNACPVSAVCWPSSARTSSREKSPNRNDSAFTLNALPPVTTAFADPERMR